MKKFFALILIIVALVSVLASCSAQTTPESESPFKTEEIRDAEGILEYTISQHGKTYMFDSRSKEEFLKFLDTFDYTSYSIISTNVSAYSNSMGTYTRYFVVYEEIE